MGQYLDEAKVKAAVEVEKEVTLKAITHLEGDLAEIDGAIAEREQSLETLKGRRGEIQAEVDEAKAALVPVADVEAEIAQDEQVQG